MHQVGDAEEWESPYFRADTDAVIIACAHRHAVDQWLKQYFRDG